MDLEFEIAYGLSASFIRIEAPLPGKRLVGVSLPISNISLVTLRQVLESKPMMCAKSVLTVALGVNDDGYPMVYDLVKMPHLLIAGQTGSGKSSCLHAIIVSLLYQATPDDVKLLLIDSAAVEMMYYNGVPHLLMPVVYEPKKAAVALEWAVEELKERFDCFAEQRVRNIESYNQLMAELRRKPMARIVIIIDEITDLLAYTKMNVEQNIIRLTQLGRAAGIHIIISSQRSSFAAIKDGLPSRIAFKTVNQHESKSVINQPGAEKLLGKGDMLFVPFGSQIPIKIWGCYLSMEEIVRVTKHVKDANPFTYDPAILEQLDMIRNGYSEISAGDTIVNYSAMSGEDGGLFEQAVEFAIRDGQISTSTLQRRLKLGYARAGCLFDDMVERKIIAVKDGSKPSRCLITREEWEKIKKTV